MSELGDAKIQIMILLQCHCQSDQSYPAVQHTAETTDKTHPHCRHISTSLIQKRNHMSTLSDRALNAGIECISREDG